MSVELNHTIIFVKDKRASAAFLAGILGLRPAPQWAGFIPVQMSNGVTLDFADADEISGQHYAFLVGEAAFDAALARIRKARIEFYAEFSGEGRGEINHLYGGRGVYFHDPNGHLFELITRPYGKTPERWSGASTAS